MKRHWRSAFWEQLNKGVNFFEEKSASGWPGWRIFWPRNDLASLLCWRHHWFTHEPLSPSSVTKSGNSLQLESWLYVWLHASHRVRLSGIWLTGSMTLLRITAHNLPLSDDTLPTAESKRCPQFNATSPNISRQQSTSSLANNTTTSNSIDRLLPHCEMTSRQYYHFQAKLHKFSKSYQWQSNI